MQFKNHDCSVKSYVIKIVYFTIVANIVWWHIWTWSSDQVYSSEFLKTMSAYYESTNTLIDNNVFDQTTKVAMCYE